MSSKFKTIILAVEASGLPDYFATASDLHVMSHDVVLDHLQLAGTWLGPRGRLEDDPRFRQIIPYIILRQGDRYVTYLRGGTGGEARLHGKVSIGLGGHIDLQDVAPRDLMTIDVETTLQRATARELWEEVSLDPNVDCIDRGSWIGLLTDNGDAVGLVHIGVVGILDIKPDIKVKSCESDQQAIQMCSLEELEAASDRLEGWTRIVLPHLMAMAGA